MRLAAVLHTTEYRGDHTVEVTVEVAGSDTVDSLLARAGRQCDHYRCDDSRTCTRLNERDWVELRAVPE